MVADGPDKGSPHDRARIVRRYLSALDARKPGRTNARTGETIAHRMHQIDTLLLSADPVQRLLLTQERIDLHAEQLRLTTASGDFDQLEKAFTRVAKTWGDRHDITYSAWRQVGVEADVLTRANIVPAAKPARPQPAAAPALDASKAGASKSDAPKTETSKTDPPKTDAPKTEASKPGAKDLENAVPQTKKTPAAKKAPAAKKTPAAKKAAPAPKAAAADPEQQRLPAEAHLLS
ncbi:MAG: hypothetical protein QOJ00_1192 [Actinomycetota bacterium]|jgi:chemotaxis protein histidine kinase CheA